MAELGRVFTSMAAYRRSQTAPAKPHHASLPHAAEGQAWLSAGEGNSEQLLEIDQLCGPKVFLSDGSQGFLDLSSMHMGYNQVTVPKRYWSDFTATEKKVIAAFASKMNQTARSQDGTLAVTADAAARQSREWQERTAEELSQIREAERMRPAIRWTPISLDVVTSNHERRAPGLIYGLEFPWTSKMLEEFGPQWLTQAFQRTGALESSNSVVQIIVDNKIKVTAGNNAGKFLFEVRYAKSRPGLHTKLFAKIPYAMTKETKQDRLSSSVLKQPMDFLEINTYRLVETLLPCKTPKFYFGDISNETSNYILITEQVPFVEMDGKKRQRELKPFEVEGPYDKCKDFQLRGDAKEYYSKIMEVSAKIAGYDKAGRMGSRHFVASSFGGLQGDPENPQTWGINPFGPSGGPPSGCMSKLKIAISFFSETAAVLFPRYVSSTEFISKFTSVMMTLSAYTREIEYWKHKDSNYVALGHANLNVDNAYFWRDQDGNLDCGVLDWGGFGAGNLGHKIWWYLNCSEFEQLEDNLEHFVDIFITTYPESGGPLLEKDVVMMMVKLTSLSNLMFMVASVPDCLRQCPAKEWPTIKDRHDPRIAENVGGKSTLRTTLRVMDNGLRMIEELGCAETLTRWVEEIWIKQLGMAAKTEAMIFTDIST